MVAGAASRTALLVARVSRIVARPTSLGGRAARALSQAVVGEDSGKKQSSIRSASSRIMMQQQVQQQRPPVPPHILAAVVDVRLSARESPRGLGCMVVCGEYGMNAQIPSQAIKLIVSSGTATLGLSVKD